MNITLICPVYNVKDYLEDTFTSIRQQTDKNFNIILVDDCSSDGSAQMCDQFAEELKENWEGEILVIHNEKNKDASFSREVGILSAKTPYIYILDSDDLIHPKLMEIGNKIINENPTVEMIINKKINMKSELLTSVKWMELKDKDNLVKNISKLSFSERLMEYGGSIANRFIKKDLILLLDYSYYKEKYPQFYLDDGLVTDLIFHEVKEIYCIEAPLYYYRIRKGGIGSSARNLEHQKEWTESDKDLLDWYLKWDEIGLYKRKLVGYIQNIMKYYYIVRCCKDKDPEKKAFINEEFNRTKKLIKEHNCNIDICNKAMIFLFTINKNIWCTFVANIYFNYIQDYKRKRSAHKDYAFMGEMFS